MSSACLTKCHEQYGPNSSTCAIMARYVTASASRDASDDDSGTEATDDDEDIGGALAAFR